MALTELSTRLKTLMTNSTGISYRNCIMWVITSIMKEDLKDRLKRHDNIVYCSTT